jgi:hypothetical protein
MELPSVQLLIDKRIMADPSFGAAIWLFTRKNFRSQHDAVMGGSIRPLPAQTVAVNYANRRMNKMRPSDAQAREYLRSRRAVY